MDTVDRWISESAMFRADFYVTGGTLRPDAPSYVERQADKDLCEGLYKGEFCYVLTSRQMGKSSLMVRTVKKLREDGVAVAVLDLTAIGQNLTIEQWYDGLISRLGHQLKLEDELSDFWDAHPELGPLQRWLTAIENVVLVKIPQRIVIFVDEIDVVRSLPFSTDEFFAAIREVFNRRSRETAFRRLAFGLLGVASPTDLIRDPRTTPFNIGRRIELHDFTPAEAAPLAKGLGPDENTSQNLLARVLFWTGGHPYLTQRLCRALADSLQFRNKRPDEPSVPPRVPTLATVDRLAEALFLTKQARERDDNLIFVRERILRSDLDVAGILHLYKKVLSRMRVPDDEANPLVTELRLAGIVRGKAGFLQVRNRVYGIVFDSVWVETNMPEAEVRRQRGARRKGVLIGLGIGAALLTAYLLLWPIYNGYRRTRMAENTLDRVRGAYSQLATYFDTFETTLDLGIGGIAVPVRGSGSMFYRAPGDLLLTLRSGYSTPETDTRIASNGRTAWLQLPVLREFKTIPLSATNTALDLPAPLAGQVGPMRLFPIYRLLLAPLASSSFVKDVSDVEFAGNAELEGQRTRILRWKHTAAPILLAAGFTNNLSGKEKISVIAWIAQDNHRILQVRMDLSPWAKLLTGPEDLNITSLVLTEAHRNIRVNEPLPKQVRFHFIPSSGWTHVVRFTEQADSISTLSFLKHQFSKLIPPRFPNAPSNLIDLSDFYNAPLNQTWHPGLPANSLDALPPGMLRFGAVFFDVRGIVQVSGKRLEAAGGHFPRTIEGIPVAQYCQRLHFLHAAGWRSKDGARIGQYTVHYEDGQERTIPIIYGEDVRDWSTKGDPSTDLRRADLVWNVVNGTGTPVRLFKTTWSNPLPEVRIMTIDFSSAMDDAAPFCIAITAES